MSDNFCRTYRRYLLTALGGFALLVAGARPAGAQSSAGSSSNTGALHLTGGIDFPSVYVFRGFVQERDPKLTLFPFADVRVTLKENGAGVLKSVDANVGVWNSLNTGSAGSGQGGFETGRIHYEEDFYTALTLGFGGGISVGTAFTAYTSPNGSFETMKELGVKVAKSHMLSPYGLVAFELSDEGQADGGSSAGTYLELGVGPAWPLGRKATITVPVKVGLSLNDYYELNGVDHKFGFFDVGGLVTVPFGGAGKFGAWNIHGGVDVYALGDTPKAFNGDDQSSVLTVASVGIGISY